MNEFDWDVVQKKRVAKQAKYKNRKKRGCTLPSDSLTPAQRKKMNGEVVTVKMNEPITWSDFKALKPDVAEEYYNGIVDRFGVGLSSIAKMMGADPSTLSKWGRLNGCKFKKVYARTGLDAIEKFTRWYKVEDEPQLITINEEEYEAGPVMPYDPGDAPIPAGLLPQMDKPTEPAPVPDSRIAQYTFRFTDVKKWDEILMFIKNMPLPENATVEIEVH